MKNNKLRVFKLILINSITFTRLVGAFILPFIYFNKGINIAALFIIILFLTDAVDGFLSRLLSSATFFGSILDALSDKILNAISFFLLGLTFNFFFCSIIIEIAILYTSYSTYRYGGNVKSSIIGKIKTIILDALVIISYLLLSLKTFNLNNAFINILISNTELIININAIIIMILCLYTLFDYMKINKSVRQNPNSIIIKLKKKKRKEFKVVLNNLFDTSYYEKHKNESILKQLYI